MAAPITKSVSRILGLSCAKNTRSIICGRIEHRALRHVSSSQLFVGKFGDPKEVLSAKIVNLPSSLESRQVLVKMMMAPINPSDINMMEGTYFVQPPLPAVMGNEGVGKIIGIGEDVKGLEVGDWVIPSDTAWGTWQTHKIANDESVIKLPNDIPVLAAATILVNPCTAYRMLKDFVNLKTGDVIIQNGANSGVGVNVIQLAKEWNIKTINIVRDRPDIEKMQSYLESLGADLVITEESIRTPEIKKLVLESFASKPKLAFNCTGGSSATELIRYLGEGGVMVTYGGMSKRPIIVPTGALLFKELKLCGYWNTMWNRRHANDLQRFEMMADLCQLMRQSKLVPPVCEFFSLENYKTAITEAIEGFRGKKIVFQMD